MKVVPFFWEGCYSVVLLFTHVIFFRDGGSAMKEKWYDKKLPWWVCIILYGIGLLVDIWWVKDVLLK